MRSFFRSNLYTIFWKQKRVKTNALLAILTLLNYACVYLSPQHFWLFGFLSLSLPCLLVIHFLLVLYWLIFNLRFVWISVLTLAFGYPFIVRTLQINWQKTVIAPQTFSVLSYNTRVFNNYEYLQKENWGYPEKMIRWVAQNPTDIKCLQEFYHRENSELFNTLRDLAQKTNYQLFSYPPITENNKNNYFGLAILSKYPIVRGGKILGQGKNYPQAIYADIKIDKDTLRVINIHLQSMAIDEKKLFKKENFWQQVKTKYIDVLHKLKNGFMSRAKEVNILAQHIEQCPYPLILCGDLNDTPYSYTYNRLRSKLHNAFEAKGNGFGFSYNGQLFFLRIDNQFFSPQSLQIQQFDTQQSVIYSDHFPLEAVYSWKRR